MSNTIQTNLLCPECGNIFPIQRKESKQKKALHKKWLYCPVCNKEINHIEIRDIDILLDKILSKEEKQRTEEEQKVLKFIKRSE